MIGDTHVHTRFSPDSSSDIGQILDAAVAKGMKEICITDHCDFDLGGDWTFPLADYTETLERYQKEYAGRIKVRIGVEMGLNPEYQETIDDFLDAYPFEYVIGSVHTMLGEDPYFRHLFEMEDEEYYRVFFRTTLDRLCTAGHMDTLGHLDYVIRYGQHKAGSYDPANYEDLLIPILQEILRRDIALELNTAGVRKGIDFVHPHTWILERYRDLGGRRVTVGSDAHAAADVGADFDRAEALIRRFGFEC